MEALGKGRKITLSQYRTLVQCDGRLKALMPGCRALATAGFEAVHELDI